MKMNARLNKITGVNSFKALLVLGTLYGASAQAQVRSTADSTSPEKKKTPHVMKIIGNTLSQNLNVQKVL